MKFLFEDINNQYRMSTNSDGITFISKIASYDLQEYYYAATTDNKIFKVYRNGKFIKKLDIDEIYLDGTLDTDLIEEVEFQLSILNDQLKPIIDRT